MKIYPLLKILFRGNLIQKAFNLMRLARKIQHYEGWLGLTRRIKLGLVFLKQRVTKPYEIKRLEGAGFPIIEIQKNSPPKVSIIIPTRNGGADFEMAMKIYSVQKGIREMEVIVVDSGSNDRTIEVATRYGAKIFNIFPDQFNHGLTRNFGAEQSQGEFMVFTVQDAIPLNEYWLQSMIDILEKDAGIAAVTGKQFLRKEADLFAKFMNHLQCDSMGLNHNEIRFIHTREDYYSLSPGDRRKLSQLDNVCCCFRKNIFDLYKFKKVSYAEDLEIGSRLARDRYKLAFLSSNGVVHSHNRSSVHFLKRSYTDARLAPKILNYYSGIPILPRGITIEEIVREMKGFYLDLGRLMGLVNWGEGKTQRLSHLESLCIRGVKSISNGTENIDEEMEAFLQEFQDMVDCPKRVTGRKWSNIFKDGFLWNLGRFRRYMTIEGKTVESDSGELRRALFKLLGLWFGSYLGSMMNAAEREGNKLIFQESIDSLLTKGL